MHFSKHKGVVSKLLKNGGKIIQRGHFEKNSKLCTNNMTTFKNQRFIIEIKNSVVFLPVNRKPKFNNRKPKRRFGLKTEPNRNRKLQNRTEPKTEKTLTDQPLVHTQVIQVYKKVTWGKKGQKMGFQK